MGNNITLHAEGSPVCSFKSSARVPVEGLRAYFSPKQSGTGNPSPSNVRAISGWNGIEVERCGKNLLNPNIFTVGKMIADDGTVSDNGSSQFTDLIPVEHKQYTFSGTNTYDYSKATRIHAYDKNGDWIEQLAYQSAATNGNYSITFTPGNTAVYIRIGTTAYLSNGQLELGSTATSYESYFPSTYPVHWNQWCKPLDADNWKAHTASHNTVTFEDGVATSEWLSAGTGYTYSVVPKTSIKQKDYEIWYVSYMLKSNTAGLNWGIEYNGGIQETVQTNIASNTWVQCSAMNSHRTGTNVYLYIAYNRTANVENLVAQVKAPIAINLTQMFGPGNEPTKEEFEEQCALNGIDLTVAIPYDEGSLKEWKTTKNLWKHTVRFPVFGKNKFNINVPYAEPSNTETSTSVKRIFQPYTYCTGLAYTGNGYYSDHISNLSISNGTLTFTSANKYYGVAFAIPVLNRNYYIDYTQENASHAIDYYTSDGTYIKSNSTKSFLVPPNTAIAVVVFYPTTANTTSTVSNIQIEEGTSATTYEPFSADNTVYGGYIDLATGEVVAEYEYMIDTWGNWGTVTDQGDGTELRYKRFTNPVYGNGPASDYSYCNVAGYSYNNNNGRTHFYIVGNSYNCRIYLPSNTDTSTVIQAVGKLQTPILLATLTPTQLLTLLGSNSIWSNASDTITCDYDLHETRTITEAKRRIAANQPHIATGGASFNTDMKAPMESLKVEFAPVQAGTGDPSPTNVRPITGWGRMSATKGKKNIGHVVGYMPSDYYLGYLSSLSGSYGQTLSTINYSLPDTPVTITQTQYDSTISKSSYKNGYMCVSLDNLTFGKYYDFSFKVSNITNNPLDAQLSDIRIGVAGGLSSPSIINNNTIIYKNKLWKFTSDQPNRKNVAIYYCGMSFTLSEFMVTPANTSDGVFEPYEGSIIPVEFPAARKNLFNKNDITLQEHLYINDSNKIILNTYSLSAFVPCLPNTTYTISKVATEKAKCGYINVAALPPTNTSVYGSIDMANLTTATITTGNDATWLMVYMNNTSYGSVTHETVLNSLQVEEGSSATTYEPYIQYYGGYVDLVTGELWRTYDSIVLDGSETRWTFNTNNGTTWHRAYFTPTNEGKLKAKNKGALFCSYMTTTGGHFWYGWISSTGTDPSILFYIPNDIGIDSQSDWTTYLNTNNLQVVYETMEPQLVTTLTPTQLKSFIGTNNIDASTGGTITTKFWTH